MLSGTEGQERVIRRTSWVLVACLLGVLSACTADDPEPLEQASTAPAEVEQLAYADHPEAVIDVHRPARDAQALVVLVHGGFWTEDLRRDLMTPLAESLADDGYVVANVEYRRVGASGGGYPETLEDVRAAAETLAEGEYGGLPIALVGHSAGGHLVTWLAAKRPAVDLCVVVSLSGVHDLVAAAEQRLGNGAVQAFLGGEPVDVPERYADASPRALDPPSAPVVLVHPEADRIVPAQQSIDYEQWVDGRGGEAEVLQPPGDHFSLIEPTSATWAEARSALDERCRA